MEPQDRSRKEEAHRPAVADALLDSFPLLPGESQWLAALLADELARIMNDE